MIAYKATYNFKCQKLTYAIGKIYSASHFEMCICGFHFCKKMKDILSYYSPSKDFKLLEIEILGDVIDQGDKSVTNKIKVLREIPASEHQLFEVDSNNNVTKVQYKDDSWIKYEYDSNNNKIREIYSSGSFTNYEYDSRNNLVKETYVNNLYSHWIAYSYDANNNQTEVLRSTGADSVKVKYDSNNNVVERIFSHGVISKNYYDSNNNLIREESNKGYWATYEYDSNNNLIRSINSYDCRRSFEYDSKNRLIRKIDINGDCIEYEYDSAHPKNIKETYVNGYYQIEKYDSNDNLIYFEDDYHTCQISIE